MRALLLLVVTLAALAALDLCGGPALAARACPSGMITCGQWCAKYRPGAVDCLVGPRSCAEKPQGKATCVGDACNPRNDSCRRQRGRRSGAANT